MRTPPIPCPQGVRAPDPAVYAAQNDAFRRHVCLDVPFPADMPDLGGGLVIGAGVRRGGLPFVLACLEAVGRSVAFPAGSDPNGHRDRGSVAVQGQAVRFVIDAHDRNVRFGSPAPDDPARTSRTLSVLLPSDG